MKVKSVIRQHPKRPYLMVTLSTGDEPVTTHHTSLVHHAKALYRLALKAAKVPGLEQEAHRLLQLIPPPPTESVKKEWGELRKKEAKARYDASVAGFWKRTENEIYGDLLFLLMKGIEDAGWEVPVDVLACYRPYMEAFKFLNQNNLFRKIDFLKTCKRTILKGSRAGLLETIRRGHQTIVSITPKGVELFNQRKREEEENEFV